MVADWIVPLHAEPSELRSACGRSFKLGLKLEPESFDPQQHASEMCNHGGCRHVLVRLFDPCCGLLSMNSSVRKKMEQCVAAVFPLFRFESSLLAHDTMNR